MRRTPADGMGVWRREERRRNNQPDGRHKKRRRDSVTRGGGAKAVVLGDSADAKYCIKQDEIFSPAVGHDVDAPRKSFPPASDSSIEESTTYTGSPFFEEGPHKVLTIAGDMDKLDERFLPLEEARTQFLGEVHDKPYNNTCFGGSKAIFKVIISVGRSFLYTNNPMDLHHAAHTRDIHLIHCGGGEVQSE